MELGVAIKKLLLIPCVPIGIIKKGCDVFAEKLELAIILEIKSWGLTGTKGNVIFNIAR